ncbi:MAG: hypothetical protein ACRDNE_10555 [Gaiellaceae bacterium]
MAKALAALLPGRASLAGSLACVVLLLMLVGHDLRPVLEPGHDHGSATVAGLCFVLLGTVLSVLLAAPPRPAIVVPVFAPVPLRSAPARPLLARSARASPAWLQRFLN